MIKLFALILLLSLNYSCNEAKTNCQKILAEDIENIVDQKRLDSIQARVELLLNNGFYNEARELNQKENWDDFIKVYIEDTHAPSNLKFETFEAAINKIPKENDILMINESHYNAEHRLFLLNFLNEFKEKGYKYLAIEALSSEQSIPIFLNNGVNPDIGFYTDEPYFTSLLLFAKELGLELLRYEPLTFDYKIVGNRDSLMADNILKQWSPSQGKLIVYCGWAHLFNQEHWLRNYLSKLHPKLNIFSINQTYLNYSMNSEYQESIRNVFGEIVTPSVLMLNDSLFIATEGYEMEIVYPKDPFLSENCFKNLKKLNANDDMFAQGFVYYLYNVSTNIDSICKVNPELIINKLDKNNNYFYTRNGQFNVFKYVKQKNELEFYKSIKI